MLISDSIWFIRDSRALWYVLLFYLCYNFKRNYFPHFVKKETETFLCRIISLGDAQVGLETGSSSGPLLFLLFDVAKLSTMKHCVFMTVVH